MLAAGAVPALCAVADAGLATRAGERRVANRWSRIEAALSDEISNDSLRGRSVCCIAVCVFDSELLAIRIRVRDKVRVGVIGLGLGLGL